MKIVLATGIYPPDIGGPATYVQALAEELKKRGMHVTVVTYGQTGTGNWELGTGMVVVRRSGGPLFRWWRYAKALKKHAADADVVLAFSLVSVGVPLWMARLKKPKKFLRLGGDFLWERYTDCGGGLGLKEWYESRFWKIVGSLFRWLVGSLLRSFDYVVFSTRFQEEIYEEHYRGLPAHSVIENALSTPTPHPSLPARSSEGAKEGPAAAGEGRTRHTPFRLLFMGRFVAFKNIGSLLHAMTELPEVMLTLVGEGPLFHLLEGNVQGLQLQNRVTFRQKATSDQRDTCFREHDLLIIPSVTEISPNVALEARAAGLPVLLTEETGLSEELQRGMVIRKLRTAEQIREAVREAMANYAHMAEEAAKPPVERSWGRVCEEYLQLFDVMSSPSPQPSPRGRGSLL